MTGSTISRAVSAFPAVLFREETRERDSIKRITLFLGHITGVIGHVSLDRRVSSGAEDLRDHVSRQMMRDAAAR